MPLTEGSVSPEPNLNGALKARSIGVLHSRSHRAGAFCVPTSVAENIMGAMKNRKLVAAARARRNDGDVGLWLIIGSLGLLPIGMASGLLLAQLFKI